MNAHGTTCSGCAPALGAASVPGFVFALWQWPPWAFRRSHCPYKPRIFDMGHQVVDGETLFLRIDDKHQISFMLQIENYRSTGTSNVYWQDKVSLTSQQLGLEIVRPRCVGAEKMLRLRRWIKVVWFCGMTVYSIWKPP